MSVSPARHWEVVVSVGLGLDAIGLLMCLWMLVSIVAFDKYHTTKDRIILALCLVTTGFIVLGNVPEKIHNLDHGYDAAIPEWNLFIAFATWWAVLIVEAMLLAYSLYILLAINPGTALRSTVLTWQTELISIVAMVLVSGTAGGINIQTLSLRCADSTGAIYLGNTTRSCNESIATINWVWLGFLMVPLVIQVVIWRQVLLANRKIGAYDEITGRGDTVTDPAVAMAPALDRVIKTVVKPLAWYPLVFLITSALYIVWIVSLYGAEREQGWARKIGPASSLVFATKGISTAGVYIVTLDRARRERGLRDQLRFRLRGGDELGVGSINENLIAQEFSHTDSSPGYSSHSNPSFTTTVTTDDFPDVYYEAH